MKKSFLILLLVLIGGTLTAERNNPFLSYNRQIEFLEKQLADAPENQKAGIQKRLDDVRKHKAKAVAKRKQPYLRRLKNLEKYLAESKSDSKKKSLQQRINQAKGEIARLDAYAGGASKYDVDKAGIEQEKKKEEQDAREKEKSKTVVD